MIKASVPGSIAITNDGRHVATIREDGSLHVSDNPLAAETILALYDALRDAMIRMRNKRRKNWGNGTQA